MSDIEYHLAEAQALSDRLQEVDLFSNPKKNSERT